jgi:GDSL-like Lipase/Acylhydrolase family
MRRLSRLAFRVFVGVELLLACSILRDVANVTTTRLYLSARIDGASSDASERFEVEAARIVPQIAIRHDERIAFPIENPWPSTLHVDLRPSGASPYEIRWRDRGADRVLARGESSTTIPVSATIPAGRGVLELVGGGPLTWVDPRLVSSLRVTRRALAFVLLAPLAILIARRQALFRGVAFAMGLAIAFTAFEVGLRALGNRAPAAILAERHDLGEVRKDPRWELTLRYGRRLRAQVDDMSEWRHGDIVRMGFIPPVVSDGVLRRFRFQTDTEGFRNARTRGRIDVAALGDSFTDAMTIEDASAWPTLIEQTTGLAVQNYGTAGFGPQQELRVLTDYALAHHPKIVVLSYFAGNDIFEAEAFEDYERSNGTIHKPDPGWPIKSVVSRADTWYVASAFHAAQRWISNRGRAEARTSTPAEAPAPHAAAGPAPRFDRGMFSIAVNGRTVRWAFMPPYLNTLRMSEGELSTRRGWTLTTDAIRAMRDASRAAGAELVVMFVPFKSQVFLPIAVEAMPHDELVSALRYSLPDGRIDVAAMTANRLAQNRMMRRFCADSGIRFLDTTDALAERLGEGVNVYFPDDSHLNEAGHAVVAATLESALRLQRMPR